MSASYFYVLSDIIRLHVARRPAGSLPRIGSLRQLELPSETLYSLPYISYSYMKFLFT